MSVYIKGMEMPKEAGKYRIEFDQCGNPYLLSDNDDGGIWHIIPVPEHGDLIDANKFFRRFPELRPYAFIAPTIIHADPEKE